MATASSSSVNGHPVRYCQTLNMMIENFDVAKRQVKMAIQTSVFNEELKAYGEAMRQSRWVVCVARQENQKNRSATPGKSLDVFLALEGNGDIELMAEKTEVRIIGWKEETVFSSTVEATSFKGVRVRQYLSYTPSYKGACQVYEGCTINIGGDVDPKLRTLRLSDYKCIGRISFSALADNPRYREDDCLRIRTEIVFSVISGGTQPIATIPTIVPLLLGSVPKPDPDGPDADECILKSSDGYRFRVEKHILAEIPYFDKIVEAIKDPKEGSTLCFDGETLEIVFEFLKEKRDMTLEQNKKVLIAAERFGLRELQKEAIEPIVSDLSIENATDALKFAADNNVSSLRARLVHLIPWALREVTVENAAKALVLSFNVDRPALRKMALDFIAPRVTEFVLAGGFEEIAAIPGMAAEVRKAAAEYMAKNTASAKKDGAPAKKAKFAR